MCDSFNCSYSRKNAPPLLSDDKPFDRFATPVPGAPQDLFWKKLGDHPRLQPATSAADRPISCPDFGDWYLSSP